MTEVGHRDSSLDLPRAPEHRTLSRLLMCSAQRDVKIQPSSCLNNKCDFILQLIWCHCCWDAKGSQLLLQPQRGSCHVPHVGRGCRAATETSSAQSSSKSQHQRRPQKRALAAIVPTTAEAPSSSSFTSSLYLGAELWWSPASFHEPI